MVEFQLFCSFLVVLEEVSHFVGEAGLKPVMVLLIQSRGAGVTGMPHCTLLCIVHYLESLIWRADVFMRWSVGDISTTDAR